ncbi:membrane protein insertase YidC [Cytobacillus kochii]|uniref:membrane protein insertase YidC n=1 Tax=Cytobacillus kochii TaxID=859143 RepID=UPI0024809201|nr:membrane protein insertase YidC [Cytobacillus kochii]
MKKIIWLVITSSLFLAGCQANGGTDTDFFHHYFVQPLISIIDFFAGIFHGNYGWSIVLVTLLLRLILLPLTVKQVKSSQSMKVKMEALQPEMKAIQEQINKTKDEAKKQKLQQELIGLYAKHGVNPMNMGCLPLLIQMPILMAIYYAIRTSPEIATHGFLWFSLGHANIPMAIIAGVIYYLQFRVSLMQLPKEQQQGPMKIMGYLSPAMILFISLSAPAALPLYWSVSGLFLIIQTYVIQKKYKKSPVVQPSL